MVAGALLAASCGVLRPEEQLLKTFFSAARLHDTTLLSRVATVDFNPRTRGVVERFRIEEREELEGGARRRLTILARVRAPSGETSDQTLRVTLSHERNGRWMITEVAGAGR
jgi:hypothetical protein